MKNIHILPTENSSILSIKDGVLTLHRPQWRKGTQYIYITSDEEIKDGDYYLYLKDNSVHKFIYKHHIKLLRLDIQKKIILTTDRELNKDGVWGIEDGFLEWFVKNPTCEYVELKGYAIILPGESCDCDNKCNICKEEELTYTEAAEKEERIFNSNIGKQETLEDISTRYHQTAYGNLIKELTKQESTADYIDRHLVEAMVEVAKQKMYNEEEVYNITQQLRLKFKSGVLKWQDDFEFDLEKWFEQFKKK